MKRKTEIDHLTSLKQDLDRGNNFVDYFIVIGLNEDTMFDSYLYSNDLETLNSKIKPEIVSKFPPFDKKILAIDDNIINHCFPNGYKIRESNSFIKPESFGFVLDNSFYSINFPQKYISCLIFYEKIENYSRIYEAWKDFDKNNEELEDMETKISSVLNDVDTSLTKEFNITELIEIGSGKQTPISSSKSTDSPNPQKLSCKSMESSPMNSGKDSRRNTVFKSKCKELC